MLTQHGLAALSELQGETDLSLSPGSSELFWHQSPRSMGIVFTSRHFWRKWWSLYEVGTLRPGFLPLSTSAEGCIAVGDGEAHPKGSWSRSEFGTKRESFVLWSKGRRMNGAAGDDGNVFNSGEETVLPYWCAVFFGSVLSYPDHPKPILLWSPYERCPANMKCLGGFLLWP